VLAAEPVRLALTESDAFGWSFAGGRHLKGIKSEVNLFRVRHRADD
jgi:adenylate cyclase